MRAAISVDRRAAYVRTGIPAAVLRHYRDVAAELRAAAFARAWRMIGRAVHGAFRARLPRLDVRGVAESALWNRASFRQWN